MPIANNTGPYVQTYSHFYLSCLDPKMHERTCGYWYTVTSHSTAHTAFATSDELMEWLSERGLKLTDTLPDEVGVYKSMRIEGTYHSASYLYDVEAFKVIQPLLKIAEMSNGSYTLGKVTEDENGVRTVHHLNPNVHERIVFPYSDIRDRKEGFQDLIKVSPDVYPVTEEEESLTSDDMFWESLGYETSY